MRYRWPGGDSVETTDGHSKEVTDREDLRSKDC
jgi:hypothetical protein